MCTQEDQALILKYKATKLSKNQEALSPVEVEVQYLISPDPGQLSDQPMILGSLFSIMHAVTLEEEGEGESLSRLPLYTTLLSYGLLPLLPIWQIETKCFGNASLPHCNLPFLPQSTLRSLCTLFPLSFSMPPISQTAHQLSALTTYLGTSQKDAVGAHKLTNRLPRFGARTSTSDCHLYLVLCVLCHRS